MCIRDSSNPDLHTNGMVGLRCRYVADVYKLLKFLLHSSFLLVYPSFSFCHFRVFLFLLPLPTPYSFLVSSFSAFLLFSFFFIVFFLLLLEMEIPKGLVRYYGPVVIIVVVVDRLSRINQFCLFWLHHLVLCLLTLLLPIGKYAKVCFGILSLRRIII